MRSKRRRRVLQLRWWKQEGYGTEVAVQLVPDGADQDSALSQVYPDETDGDCACIVLNEGPSPNPKG